MPRKTALSLLLTLCTFLPALAQMQPATLPPIDPAKLAKIDTDPTLTSQVGEDRLLKYVLRTAASGDSAVVVNRQYLERSIAESLQDGSAMALIGQDLAHGDTRLRSALVGVFQTFNYNAPQIEDIFRRWAAGQNPEVARAVLNNTANESNALRFLSTYILDTPDNWSLVLNNGVLVETQKLPLTPAMMQSALVNSDLLSRDDATKLLAAAGNGDIDARSSVADLIIKLQSYRGTVARYLEENANDTRPASWYGHVYDAMMKQIAQDPLYLTDYAKRSSSATVLYNAWGDVMEKSLEANDKNFFLGYYEASQIPGSQFSVMISNLLGGQTMQQQLGTDEQQISNVLRTKAIATMRTDPKTMGQFMWQLTRPAEVLSLAIRHALPSVLSSDPTLAQEFAQELPRIGGQFNTDLRATTAFSYYNNDPGEFRRRLQDGKMTREGLQQFGQQAGQLLASSDTAWKDFFAGNGGDDNLSRLLTQGAITEDRDTAIYLILTIETNDSRLNDSFGRWMITNNDTHDMNSYAHWLDSVVRSLQMNSAVGNEDVAHFKAWFTDYLKTPDGWAALSRHLAIESTLINEPLRDSIATYLSQNPDALWSILRLIGATHGDTTVTVRAKLRYYVIAGHVNEILLRQIAAQNQVAADAAYPVWDQLLRPGSLTITGIQQTVEGGTVLNDLAAVVIQSLIDVMNRPDYEVLMDGAMRQLTGQDASVPPSTVAQKTQSMLTYDAPKCTDFFKACFANPKVNEAWRINFLNQVRLNGKAYVVADYLIRNPDLQAEWANLVANATTRDVTLWKQIMQAFVYRQVSTDFLDQGPTVIYYNLSRLLVEDRVMYEQLLHNPGGSYQADYLSAVSLQVGVLGARAWVGAPQ